MVDGRYAGQTGQIHASPAVATALGVGQALSVDEDEHPVITVELDEGRNTRYLFVDGDAGHALQCFLDGLVPVGLDVLPGDDGRIGLTGRNSGNRPFLLCPFPYIGEPVPHGIEHIRQGTGDMNRAGRCRAFVRPGTGCPSAAAVAMSHSRTGHFCPARPGRFSCRRSGMHRSRMIGICHRGHHGRRLCGVRSYAAAFLTF